MLRMNEVELNELLTDLGPARPSRTLLSDVATATQGNPLLAAPRCSAASSTPVA